MHMTMRWFGKEEDTVTLEYIRHIPGVQGIVGALHAVPVGAVWPMEELRSLVTQVHDSGLKIEVIESINVHDDIKIGLSSRDKYIENYQKTIRNIAQLGVKVVCYNFMPVFDWIKTDMSYILPDGSSTMAFEKAKLDNNPKRMVNRILKDSRGFSLPGWEPNRISNIQSLIAKYCDVDNTQLRKNLKYFLEAVIPVCEEVGLKMAIHPDDPPYSVFGLPRIVKDRYDLDWICKAVDSEANGITFCTGSIAEDPCNDVYSILAEFTHRRRVPFAHVRNIKFTKNMDFYESAHLSQCGSLDMYKVMKALYENGFDGYIRPDHGRFIWGEIGRPGYGLFDRALGITYLTGLWESLSKS